MAAWLELSYDLIFVAAILVFRAAVGHLHDAGRIIWVVGVFVVLSWIWVSTTMYINRFRVDNLVERVLVYIPIPSWSSSRSRRWRACGATPCGSR
jgi:low temperature requirement protein LtrA